METLCLTRQRGRRGEMKGWAAAVILGVWAVWGTGGVCAAPHPHPDSPEAPDIPPPPPVPPPASATSGNAVGMFVLSPRAPIVVVAGGRGRTTEELVNYYLPVIMAEMDAPVSTRDPSIIRVAGCRQGFNEDPLGACRPVFVPRTYYPRTSTRPHRQTSIASLLPVRPRPRVPRPQPQTQRDLIRQFNTSRRRPSWFGRALAKDTKKDAAKEFFGKALVDGDPSVRVRSGVGDVDAATTATTTTTTTTTPSPDTSECDD